MENASKALLIAGAILIVIVLISIGMMIVQNASGITDSATDTATKQIIEVFNQEYTRYQGKQRGASVKTLLASISANNASNSSEHKIKVTITDSKTAAASIPETDDPTQITRASANIVGSATYTVEVKETDPEGYITAMLITR